MGFSVSLILALAVVGTLAQSDQIPPGFTGPIEPKKTAPATAPVEIPTDVQSEVDEIPEVPAAPPTPAPAEPIEADVAATVAEETPAEAPTEVATEEQAQPPTDPGADVAADAPSFARSTDGCDRYGSDITEALRSATLNGDINCAAKILSENSDIDALAKGFRFDSDQRNEVLAKSDNRNDDPDVIAMKVIAKSALDTGDAAKLAAVMVVSTLERRDETIEAALREDLSNTELMSDILNADANSEFVPSVSGLARRRATLSFGSRRRLMCDGCTPTDSLICAHCWAKDVCNKFFWCK